MSRRDLLGIDENFLKLDCDDCCTTVNLLRYYEIVHLKWVKLILFKLYLNETMKNKHTYKPKKRRRTVYFVEILQETAKC